MRIKITTIVLGMVLSIAGPTTFYASGEEWSGPVAWTPPPSGVVADAETAVRIAEAVLPAQGAKAQDELRRYKPWSAIAVANAWEVRGSLPKNMAGGTYVVVIARSDGRVLSIFHEQ